MENEAKKKEKDQESSLVTFLKKLLRDPVLFAQHASGLKLRGYQEGVIRAVVDSVICRRGLSIVVLFPRQSGKNELQAQLETYLLVLLSMIDAEVVKVSPTWKPQSLNAMRRLERVLGRNLMARTMWTKESGYIYRVGQARIYFLSGAPSSNIVGATARTLLECDEAQDVTIEKWDKEVNPMAASTNATKVFWGTAWTSQTLLARELRAAQEAEKRDGLRRVFKLTADDVRKEVEAYGQFVDGEIAKLGRNHPFVKTQFYSEEIDAEGGLFPPARVGMMSGTHARLGVPVPGEMYAFLLDVAGGDETNVSGMAGDGAMMGGARDATALTIVRVDASSIADPGVGLPRYEVVQRWAWVNVGQARLYGFVRALVEMWDPRRVVVDATGIGAGLASFLNKAFPEKVRPFVFSFASKSSLAWQFLGVIEGGRFKDYADKDSFRELFLKQCEACQFEVMTGPGRLIKWGVPEGTRSPDGDQVHDDFLLSAALVAELDAERWGNAESTVVSGFDPIQGMKEAF